MKRIEFKAPAGVAPEGKTGGDTFESMATFQIKANGRMCLVAIGDHKMPGYDDKQTNDDVAGRYQQAIQDQMG